MAAQLALLGRAVGWEGPARSRILGDDCRQALQLRHWSEIVLGQVDFDGFDLTSPLGEIPNRMVAVSERARDDTIEKFPVLRGFVTGHGAGAVRLGTPVTGQRALSGAAPDQASDDLLEVMRRRWSGLENDGSPAQVAAFDRAALDELMADVRLLAARSLTGDLAAVPLSVSVTVLHGQAGVAGHYCLRPGARDLEPLGPVDAAQLGSFSNHYYWAGINMIMGLSVAPGIVFEVCPNAPFAAIHAAVGAFGHSFALAAARRGMFVRPVRAYREAALDSVTPDSELMVLQLICGTSRQARVGLDLI